MRRINWESPNTLGENEALNRNSWSVVNGAFGLRSTVTGILFSSAYLNN